MAQTELNVVLRERVGKGGARRARREGFVPGVVYGSHIEPCPIKVDRRALSDAISGAAGWNTMLTLNGDGPFNGLTAVVKDMQIDSILRHTTNVDFQALDMTKKGSFMIPVVAVGVAAGQKEGGNLEIIRKELEVLCMPTAVPDAIEINVEDLKIGDVIHVEEVVVPDGVELCYDVNFTVMTLVGYKETEVAEAIDDAEEVVEVSEETE